MPFFKVVSHQSPPREFEFDAADISAALALAYRHRLVEADLWEDGLHRYVIRRDDDLSQLWIVTGISQAA